MSRLNYIEKRNKLRRKVMQGFPWNGKFKTKEEIYNYFSGDRVQCLLCGKWFQVLHSHLRFIHDINSDEYRETYGLPWKHGLCGKEVSLKLSKTMKKRRENGFRPDIDAAREKSKQVKAIMESFRTGVYRFDVQAKITLSCGETIALWSSRDALIIKVLTGIIQEKMKPFMLKTCYHLKGHGGLKGAVRDVMKQLPKYKFFCKTDVHSYYDSIDHYTMLMKLHDYIEDRTIIGYVWQFLNRCVEWGGLYQDFKKGIPRGSSLSPLLGAFYLLELDQMMEKLDVKYFRYMDDILILAPTRWKLKKAIRVLNQTFNELNLEKHPEKTLIGRLERGFDFLGYRFEPQGLTLAKKTISNFITKALRLYEQEPPHKRVRRLGEYVVRWRKWSIAGGTLSTAGPLFSASPAALL